MLNELQKFFRRHLNQEQDEKDYTADLQEELNLAAAVLMVEMARADLDFSVHERQHITKLLQSTLSVDDQTVCQLVDLAEAKSEQSTSLYEFTEILHQHYTMEQKMLLMKKLWSVALSDHEVQRYEDGLLHKISRLLYLDHKSFIEAKQLAKAEMDAGILSVD